VPCLIYFNLIINDFISIAVSDMLVGGELILVNDLQWTTVSSHKAVFTLVNVINFQCNIIKGTLKLRTANILYLNALFDKNKYNII